MIVVDTSVWIDHLRKGVPGLAAALEEGQVLMHPFVLGEIACGNLRNRENILNFMATLPSAPVATDAEALEFLESRSITGRGIGYIDVHLLASTALADAAGLWTKDARLHAVASELKLEYAAKDGARH